jgi:hypothetical protein
MTMSEFCDRTHLTGAGSRRGSPAIPLVALRGANPHGFFMQSCGGPS